MDKRFAARVLQTLNPHYSFGFSYTALARLPN
jgi:hypothetical protein